MKEKLNFETDDFIKKVVEDPANVQSMTFLQGYLGASDKTDFIRLYYDPGLKSFTDIKKDDVVHLQKISKNKNPLGGVMLWVKASDSGSGHTCNCSRGDNKSNGQQYFQGNVYNQYLGQQQGAGGAWPTSPWMCPHTQKCR